MVILIVEDDEVWRDLLTRTFCDFKNEVISFKSAIEAMKYLATFPPFDAILVDNKLPGGPAGVSLVKQFRPSFPGSAFLMMSSFADKELVVEALRADVDDFILRPIEVERVVERVSDAVIKHQSQQSIAAAAPATSGLEINPAARQVMWRGKTLDLTPAEFGLLVQFAARPGHILNYSELYAASRGQHVEPAEARTRLRSHIGNIRRKMELAGMDPEDIPLKAVRGYGFKWDIDLASKD